jgi:WD40 repeat protein
VRAPQHPVHSRRGAQTPVRSLAIARDGCRIVAGCHDGHALIVRVTPDAIVDEANVAAHDEPILRVAIAPDEQTFVTTSADSSAKLWGSPTRTSVPIRRN